MPKHCASYLMAVLTFMSLTWNAPVFADTNKEYQLKAAYMLNFARFIYWPDDAFSTTLENFNICVFGENPFGNSLDRLSSKKIHNKTIKIIYTKTLQEAESCHIVYFSKTEETTYEQTINQLPQFIKLTVSDIKGFSERGGMIEFIRVKNKIKFEINVDQSAKSGIKYRSQLLEVAEQLR